MPIKRNTLFFFLFAILFSCGMDKDEASLNSKDISYIKRLGILDKGETIELFESNGGLDGIKQSGNFITPNRIASYWIEDDNRRIESAYFNEVDSMSLTDLVSKLTYASYITVYKSDGHHFEVYVDADSSRTYQFYEHALQNWEKHN